MRRLDPITLYNLIKAESNMRTPIILLVSIFLTANSFASIGRADEKIGKEYIDSAERIAEAFNERSAEAFSDLLDMRAVSERALEGMKFKRVNKRNMIVSLDKAKGQVADLVISMVPEGSITRFVRARRHPDGIQVLIRSDMGDYGFNYRDFLLGANAESNARIIDWYDYSGGQSYSESIRQSLIAMLPSESNYVRLFELVTGKQESKEQFKELFQAVAAQDVAKFFSVYDELGDDLNTHRLILIVAFGMATKSNDEARSKHTLSLLAEHYGDDEALQFLLLDHFYYENEYEKAIFALENLAAHMGIRDSVNWALTSITYNQLGDTANAIKAGKKSIEMESDNDLAYWSLLTGYAAAKLFGNAVGISKALEDKFDYEISSESLGELSEYVDLVASQEFKEWEASK